MDSLEALVLGLLQGLTEYLPVSSSGHLTIGAYLFGIQAEENLAFTIAVHVATVLSTLVILWKEVEWLFKDVFGYFANPGKGLNDGMKYFINIVISMIPVGVVGLLFKDEVEEIFCSGLLVVGLMLLLTALLLTFSYFYSSGKKEKISVRDAFIIGIAQACAVMPGLSRSGSTIATGLLLGNKKEKLAQFSFLMVIPPILGQALLDVIDMVQNGVGALGIDIVPLMVGFVAAFVSGCLACKWMINIVKKGKLIYFAIYCAIVGSIVVVNALI